MKIIQFSVLSEVQLAHLTGDKTFKLDPLTFGRGVVHLRYYSIYSIYQMVEKDSFMWCTQDSYGGWKNHKLRSFAVTIIGK